MARDPSPADRNAAFLTVVVDHVEKMRIPLTTTTSIGRSLDCDIWLEDSILSRHHCRLEPAVEGDGWAVVDLKSRNGTFVNARRVTDAWALTDGDIITVGRAHITFHAKGYVPPRPAGPHEAAKLPANRAAMKQDGAVSSRPLPTARMTNADTLAPGDSGAGVKPLPFTRPPARPIVKPNPDQE